MVILSCFEGTDNNRSVRIQILSCSKQTKSPLTNEHCKKEREEHDGRGWGNYGFNFFSLLFRKEVRVNLSSGFSYYLWFRKLTKL